ncbi:MAG TPA: diguanylate cyclase [Usitatibacteraceae bacterium]|nr:diguanylate cyclase [Usitatibacteraceae bacterium]
MDALMESELDAKLMALREQLRRRRPAIPRPRFRAFATQILQAIPEQQERETFAQWLDGLYYLSRYEESRADESLAAARENLDRLLAAEPLSIPLNRLSAAINEAAVETAYMRNDYQRALELAKTLRVQSLETADRQTKAVAATWYGLTLLQTGRYQEALKTLARAVADFELAGAGPQAARALTGLCIVHEELGDLDRALPLYQHALARAEADANADMEGRVLANWGDALVQIGRYQDGIRLLERAVLVLTEINASWHSAWCMLSIGRAQAALGDLDRAAATMKKALRAVRRSASPRIEAEVLAGIGALATQTGDEKLAMKNLEAALRIAQDLNIEREQFKIHRLLAEACRRFGRQAEALDHFVRFHELQQKVYDEMARVRIEEVEGAFELEKARRDRELFQLRNVELASALDEVRRLNEALAEKARVLEELSYHDMLTGLHNRRYLFSRLASEMQRFQRYGMHFSVAIYDVDHFKPINDSHSHAVGDAVLAELARVIAANLRESDVHARYGGEEFAVILPASTLSEATLVMEKLRQRVAAHDWDRVAKGLVVTISVGVAEADDDADGESVLRRADQKLYAAKAAGRNRVVA